MLASPTYFLPQRDFDEKRDADIMSQRTPYLRSRRSAGPRPPPVATPPLRASPKRTSPTPPPTRPVAVPLQLPITPHQRSKTVNITSSKTIPAKIPSAAMRMKSSRHASAHDPNALPPAVAALLAMTTIPRPKPRTSRQASQTTQRTISSAELLNDWKVEEIEGTPSGSPLLDLLLQDDDEDVDEFDDDDVDRLQPRSSSAESLPSLENDDQSILSMSSLQTPDSLRSKESYMALRNAKRVPSLPIPELCSYDHPLLDDAPKEEEDEEPLVLSRVNTKTSTLRSRLTIKSNLTASLQALKNVAISSIASLSFNNATNASPSSTPASPFADNVLWSNPYLLPHMSSEVQPAGRSTRRHSQSSSRTTDSPLPLPDPLNFEEQEEPYQLALHAPYLADQRNDLPAIPMQTYSTRCGRRKFGPGNRYSSQHKPSSNSEAGRAARTTSPDGTALRHREPRENPDFLRVIVMEMNMRRVGKLEGGRARLWLPPRVSSPATVVIGGAAKKGCRRSKSHPVPSRWVGVSAGSPRV